MKILMMLNDTIQEGTPQQLPPITAVVGALGTVKKEMVEFENIEKVSKRANATEIQKICMLGSARILRKELSI